MCSPKNVNPFYVATEGYIMRDTVVEELAGDAICSAKFLSGREIKSTKEMFYAIPQGGFTGDCGGF